MVVLIMHFQNYIQSIMGKLIQVSKLIIERTQTHCHHIGIVGFTDQGYTVHPIQSIINDGDKQSLMDAVDTLRARGDNSIHNGILHALRVNIKVPQFMQNCNR